MSRLFYHVMQDNVGNLLFDVSGTMRVAGTATLATIYGDEALTVILPNPMTNHPSFGSFKCFLGVGDYDFHMAKAGYTFETLTGVQGHGSMAQQDASAVAIAGGSGAFTAWSAGPVSAPSQGGLLVGDAPGGPASAYRSLMSAGTSRYQLYLEGTATNYMNGMLGIQTPAPVPPDLVRIQFRKSDQHALTIQQTVNDTGTGIAILFQNVAGTPVGAITTTGAATAYNTSSDRRLKTAIEGLTDALATVQQLLPVRFRWQADGSPGVGFVADEVQAVVPEAVTGTPDGPQMQGVDFSKLVPYLVSAVQALVQRVEALEAR